MGQVVISSTVMEFRKHNRVVDAVLLTVSRAGVFFMKTKLYGSTAWIKKAYRVALQEVNSERIGNHS